VLYAPIHHLEIKLLIQKTKNSKKKYLHKQILQSPFFPTIML